MSKSTKPVVTKATMTDKQANIVRQALLHIPRSERTPVLPTKGMKVYARDESIVGVMTGGFRSCRMEGCTGRLLGVRWPDKKITFPCSKSVAAFKDGIKIQ